jgi:hypothetical protein
VLVTVSEVLPSGWVWVRFPAGHDCDYKRVFITSLRRPS